MKHLNLCLFLVLCLGGWAAAAPQKAYVNDTLLTIRTNIDATVVINDGTIFYDTISSNIVSGQLFQTQDTLYLTNNGTMFAQPGFIFNTHSATGARAAASFNNSGTITALDAPTVAFWAWNYPPLPISSQPPGTGGALIATGTSDPFLVNTGSGTNQPVPSAIEVSAASIVNTGMISVGDLGSAQFNGTKINLSGGGVAAGSVSETDPNATSARGVVAGYSVTGSIYSYYSPPPVTYDICWAKDNGSNTTDNIDYVYDGLYYLASGLTPDADLYLGALGFPIIGADVTAGTIQGDTRNGYLEGVSLYYAATDPCLPSNVVFSSPLFPISALLPPSASSPVVSPVWSSYAYYNVLILSIAGSTNYTTNYYYNIIYVNTAFADPDMTAQVAFYGTNLLGIENEPLYGGLNTISNGSPYAMEGMVRFSAPVKDVNTGLTVSNSIYFLDTSALQAPNFYSTNTLYATVGYAKPLGFEITRNQPVEWTSQIPPNEPLFDPVVLVDNVSLATGPMTNSFYIAQVGRNPEDPNGLDPYSSAILGPSQTSMPDPTNEPGRIEINASSTLAVSNMTMRGNGYVTLNAPSLLGTPAATDFGNWNVNLGNLSTPLLITNLFPATFHRLRGDIAAYSVDWENVVTNDGFNTVTNTNYYHVLILDQDLRDSFKPTGLNMTLRGSSVGLDDDVRVVGSALIQTPTLTVNSNLTLIANAGALHAGNMPLLKRLLIGSGGSILADNNINLGFVPSAHPANPSTLNTPILSITNLGLIGSGDTELQSQVFAQGGTIIATNGGSLTMNAITNYLGAGLGLSNALIADHDIHLTSTSIQVTNSTLLAGQGGNGRLVLNASAALADHLPNTASTNAYHTNIWQATGGFSLPVKPASGDLFGTQITTIASNYFQTVVHVWAGQDLGPTATGFFNNEVIGHLVLDRRTNATLQFSAAGKKNAMYVDYLELQDLSFSDYHNGLVVDDNFTIYFANANVDPSKLQKVYPNIVWVPQFAGPNSATNVLYQGAMGNCLMNAALAASSSIDSDGDGIPNLGDPHPLNNSSVGAIPCPSLVTSTEALSVTGGVSGQMFMIWAVGQGTVTTNLLPMSLTVGQSNTVTAVPASGWLFTGWSGPAAAGQTAAASNSPTLKFATPTNLFSFLAANFITNPFIALAGAQFNGLFSVPGAVALNDSGFVTFTLKNNGVFSGSLRFGSTNYPFSSQFNIAESATAFATNGTNKLTVALQLGQSPQLDAATGSVTNANFQAGLKAYRKPAWTAANPAPQAGSYTLVLPGNANAAAGPGGDSYGTATVDASGNLTAIVTLADNVTYSQSVPVSQGGQWPLYITPSGVAQPLLGWVAFDTNGTGGKPIGFGGTVTWIRAAGPGTYYTNGFTNSSVLLGSVYSAAYQKTNGLALNNPTLTLSGGNLPASVTDNVTVSGLETYQAPGKNPTLTINAATGLFTGQYVEPVTGRKVTLAGAVLQSNRVAGGFFLGTNQTGAVWLQGN